MHLFYVLEAENGFALSFLKNKGKMEINFLERTKLQGEIRFGNLLFSVNFSFENLAYVSNICI
jgi:hypothetical protein